MKRLTIITGVLMMLFLSSCRDIANSVLDLLPPFDVAFSTNIEIFFRRSKNSRILRILSFKTFPIIRATVRTFTESRKRKLNVS